MRFGDDVAGRDSFIVAPKAEFCFPPFFSSTLTEVVEVVFSWHEAIISLNVFPSIRRLPRLPGVEP